MLTGLEWTLTAALAATSAKVIRLPAPGEPRQTLALHCVEPRGAGGDAVLFVHGASFPTLLAAGYEFDGGDSWMGFMAAEGFLACGLDFLGFGASSRPAAMSEAPEGATPLVRAPEAARQITAAADYLRRERAVARLHVVAHSWGTIPAGVYAAAEPAGLGSLTLFGPVVPVAGGNDDSAVASWWTISAKERFEQLRFADVLPRGLHLLEPAVVRRWASEFAASEPGARKSISDPLRIPAGPLADAGAAQAGRYPYAASEVRSPVLVVYGDYDTVVDDAGAAAFLDRFTASPLKWRLRIDHGTHVMHLERGRRSLYESVAAFIRAAAGTRLPGCTAVYRSQFPAMARPARYSPICLGSWPCKMRIRAVLKRRLYRGAKHTCAELP